MEQSQTYDIQYYTNLKDKYLEEAEKMFGPKTEYLLDGICFGVDGPKVEPSFMAIVSKEKAFVVTLNPVAQSNHDSGVFQISHEVVHLISPLVYAEEEDVNFLEEGMATYFSKLITERETGNFDIAILGMNQKPLYKDAYELYLKLIETEPCAVKKLRKVQPEIALITKETFEIAELTTDAELIVKLLKHFPRN